MMSSTACLLVLLAIAFPVQAVEFYSEDTPPNVFPSEIEPVIQLQDALIKIRGSCPPFGHPDYKYTVTVLGTHSPMIGGCASSIRVKNSVIPSFDLYLASIENGGGDCGRSDMDHYTFECLTKTAFYTDDENIRGWYITLYDQTAKWSGYQDYKCALYEITSEDPPTIQMVISGNRSCDDLPARLEETDPVVPEGLRHFADGSVALKFVRDKPPRLLWRKKRSITSQSGGCRFPDWSQGSWSDLQVDGSMARYDSAFHEKDDDDYGQESDDGKDGDAETTGGDQFMQRSQRQAPVGTSDRNRRSIPFINGVKMYRTHSGTNQNNIGDKDWLKHQLFNDNIRINDLFHSRRERRNVFLPKLKSLLDNTDYNLDTIDPITESVEDTSIYENVHDTLTTTPKDDNTDLDEESNPMIYYLNLRKKRHLQDQHNLNEENTKNRKEKCWWGSETTTPAPVTTFVKTFYFGKTTPGPSTPAIDTRTFYVGTSDPTSPIKKKRSVNVDLDNKSKSKKYDEKTEIEKIKISNQFNEIMRWWKFTQTLPMIPLRNQEQSKEDTTEFPIEFFPFEKNSDIKNPSNQGEEGTNNKRKGCYCYKDVEDLTSINDKNQMKLFHGIENYFTTTSKYTADLNEKSNSPFDFEQLRKKRDLENLSNFDRKNMKNKKKRCYCDNAVGFHTPTNDGDPMKILRGMEKYFTTTSKYTADLNKESNFPFDFIQLRKKRDTQYEQDNKEESIEHRQKRCHHPLCKFFEKTTTSTERYRDVQFENPPKMWDPVEPFAKTNKYFGTTFSPAGPNRDKKSIDEDLDNKSKSTKDDEEAFLQKVKIINQINGFVRWWNIMRAISTTGNHGLKHLNEKIKDDEYAVFPENITVPSPIKYFETAQKHGFPYNETLKKWLNLERANRLHEAHIDFLAYPGQNHPDIVMRDFDQTFDGIEYDFDPMYPEGTAEDPTAYRALTLPGGYRLEPRLSRRTTYEQKKLRNASESSTVAKDQENDTGIEYRVPSMEYRRMRRSSPQQNQQQRETTKFTWRCMMPVENDETQAQYFKTGAKFLTYGGRIVNKNVQTDNDQINEQELDALVDIKDDSKMSYGCMWLVPRGPNILEFSIIGTGMPEKTQDLQSFARELCAENKTTGRDSNVRNQKKLRPRRHWWVTETRTDDSKRVPVGCPVPPGIVFYGVIPAPPPPSTVSTSQPEPMKLCARLVSSADDCKNGQMGPSDQMKYTVSECVEENATTFPEPKMIFEAASRGYTVGGSWRRNKRHSAPTDASTVTSSVTTSISSSMPILPSSGHNSSTRVIDNITNHQMTGSTATFSTATTSSSMVSSSNGSQHFVDITTIDPTILVTTTTTPTTFSTATSSNLPLSSPQDTTFPERQLPSLSMSSTTTPSTSTATITTASSYYPVTNYQNRQQQQWQQQHQQPNNNNNDYYYRGRQQNYPPPPPGSTGTDYNYYYLQRQQQLWQQQHPQTQSHWSPQQHPITTRDYSNNHQKQSTDSSGHRIEDYYYRQQQQNYYNHQYNNDRQQQMPQPRNSSLMLNHPNGGSWNVHGDRLLYISNGGGGDSNRDIPVAWNISTSIGSSNNGGWSTVEQQHWWYQQQQQQQQRQQQQQQQQQQQLQQQQQQQQQQQHWQQQNNRGLGGILSLPPVPLPPLHVEQGAVTVSIPTPLPLHPRRQQKPPNHYYLPTLTTKTFSQPYQLRSKSESRYYQEREYQCLGQWTEAQQQMSPVAGEKPIMLTYTYVKRLNPVSKGGSLYECFVGTPIPNDEGLNPETTTTLLLTEAGTGTKCSRLSDPYRSGMKLVGTKIQGACKGSVQPGQDTVGGSWYSMKPQPISPSVPSVENGGGTWYAAPPVPVVAQNPATKMPILTGRHTGGNGATFISRQNEHRSQSATPPSKTNHSLQTIADMRIVLLLVGMLLTRHVNNIINHRFID